MPPNLSSHQAYIPLTEERLFGNDVHAAQSSSLTDMMTRNRFGENDQLIETDILVVHENIKRASVQNITMNTMNYMLVPLSMPATLAASGWVWGLLLFVGSTVWSYWTGLVIGDAYIAHPELKTFPEMSAEAIAIYFCDDTGKAGSSSSNSSSSVDEFRGAVSLDTDNDYAQYAVYGSGGVLGANRERKRVRVKATAKRTVAIVQFLTFYLDAVCQFIYMAQYLSILTSSMKIKGLFGTVGWCQSLSLSVVSLLLLPVTQLPTFHDSKNFVYFAIATLTLSVAVFTYEVLSKTPWESCEIKPQFSRVSTASKFVSVANFAYAYGGHGLFPEEMAEMVEPERWPEVMNWSYFISVPVYLFVGAIGYAAYGDATKADINLNFPNDIGNALSIAFQFGQCYYAVFFCNVALCSRIEILLGFDPTDWFTNKHQYLKVNSFTFRLFFRTLFLGTQTLVAAIFLASGGDVLLDLQGIAGSFGMALMTFLLPSLMRLTLVDKPFSFPSLGKLTCYSTIALALVVIISGLYGSVSDLGLDFRRKMPRDTCLPSVTTVVDERGCPTPPNSGSIAEK